MVSIFGKVGLGISSTVLYGYMITDPVEVVPSFSSEDVLHVGNLYLYPTPNSCYTPSQLEVIGKDVAMRFRSDVGINFESVKVVSEQSVTLNSNDFMVFVLSSSIASSLGVYDAFNGAFGIGVEPSGFSSFVYSNRYLDLRSGDSRVHFPDFSKEVYGSQIGYVVERVVLDDSFDLITSRCDFLLLDHYLTRVLTHELGHAFGASHPTEIFGVTQNSKYVMGYSPVDPESLTLGRFTPVEIEVMRYFVMNYSTIALEDRIGLRSELAYVQDTVY